MFVCCKIVDILWKFCKIEREYRRGMVKGAEGVTLHGFSLSILQAWVINQDVSENHSAEIYTVDVWGKVKEQDG